MIDQEKDISENNSATLSQKKSDEKLERVLKSSKQKVLKFLSDPDHVAIYNAHINKIINTYQTREHLQEYKNHLQSLKIKPNDHIIFEQIDFTINSSQDDITSHISGTHIDFRHIHLTPEDVKLPDDEVEKVVIHEMAHGLFKKHKDYSPKIILSMYGLSEKDIKDLKHVEELACDSVSDSAKVWPRRQDLEKNEIHNYLQYLDLPLWENITGKNLRKVLDEYFKGQNLIVTEEDYISLKRYNQSKTIDEIFEELELCDQYMQQEYIIWKNGKTS